jgi:hypothetical protein
MVAHIVPLAESFQASDIGINVQEEDFRCHRNRQDIRVHFEASVEG